MNNLVFSLLEVATQPYEPEMLQGWIWPALAMAFGIGSTFYNNNQNRKAAERANRLDKKRWDEQNLYNHPINQMARLHEAGLNPNMIYGSSPGSAVGNAGAQQAANVAEVDPMENPIVAFSEEVARQAQTDNIRSQTGLNTANALRAAREAGLRGQELENLKAMSPDIIAQKKAEMQVAQVKAAVQKGTQQKQIEKFMDEASIADMARQLKQKELDFAQRGIYKNPMQTFAELYQLDLKNPVDRVAAQTLFGLVTGSHIWKNLTGGYVPGGGKKTPTQQKKNNKPEVKPQDFAPQYPLPDNYPWDTPQKPDSGRW